MFIVFEGIDGSGKTTISNRVAEKLRAQGIEVEHIREGGEFASPLVSRMREFGKDPRNMAMDPYTEFLLYVARDAQLLSECIEPALKKSQLVFADRYLYSYDVLGHDGRGLPRERIQPVLEAASKGIWPEFVILMDVDPHLARARRKVSKIADRAKGESTSGGSRKGLGGVGMKHRLREGYLELARKDPKRWLVVDNTHAELDVVVDTLAAAIASWVGGTDLSKVISDTDLAFGKPKAVKDASLKAGHDAFYDMIERRGKVEPTVAAYFLSGLSDPRAYEFRERFFDDAAHVVANGLSGLDDEHAWKLRERLVKIAPVFAIKSVTKEMESERVWAFMERFVSSHLGEIVGKLTLDDSERAWKLRKAYENVDLEKVLRSLSRLDTEQAWTMRREFISSRGKGAIGENPLWAGSLASSVRGIGGEEAFAIRSLCAKAAPSQVISSLSDLECDQSWQWRHEYVEHAPKLALRTFDGQMSAQAWDMRERFAETVKESIDSMIGLDGERSWAIRERVRGIWPSTVVKSLGPLGLEAKGLELALEVLSKHSSNFSVLKHVTTLHNLSQAGAAI